MFPIKKVCSVTTAIISSVTFQNFYLGKTKPEMNLPRQTFDEFALGKSL